jgi:hypothetical protein
MQHSKYASDMSRILAALETPENDADDTQRLPEEEEGAVHIYPGNVGGIPVIITAKQEIPPEYLSDTPEIENAQPQEPPFVESEPPATPARKEPPYFLYYLLLLIIFVLLDNVGNIFTLLGPTATITIIPTSHTISANTTLALSDVRGRILPALTLAQSETTQATGKGHQDALSATGILTFYNAAFTPQTIDAGTVFTSGNGVQIVTETTLTIPANNPPSDGEASTTAHAVIKGADGNIAALSINGMLSSTLYVKNLTDFSGGRNERSFTYVRRSDIQQAISALTPRLFQNEQAVFTSQLQPGEVLISPTCITTTTSDHQAGDEAATVKVSVLQTCSAGAYNQHILQTKGTMFLTSQATRTLGNSYQLVGSVQVQVTHTSHTPQLVLSLSMQGTWVYQINEIRLKSFVAGKPRLTAIQLLTRPGIEHVTINGITDNQPLPDDTSHIHIIIISLSF